MDCLDSLEMDSLELSQALTLWFIDCTQNWQLSQTSKLQPDFKLDLGDLTSLQCRLPF